MARKLFLAAGVLSLILVGLRGEAQAATTHDSYQNGADVLDFFGHRLCFANAPATAQCDWRVPSSAAKQQAGPLAADIDIFGVNYCLGAETGAQCNVEIAAPEKNAQRNHFHFMGMTFCVPGTHCHSSAGRLAGK